MGKSDPICNEIKKIVDCWNRIGVHGDISCEELKHAVHCRNCNKFSLAARAVFSRLPDTSYIDEWSEHLTAKKEIVKKNIESVMIFRLGSEWLAVKSEFVLHVLEVTKAHSVPGLNNDIFKGIVNVRGKLNLFFSLKNTMGIDDFDDYVDKTKKIFKRMVVIDFDGNSWAFIADEVQEIYRYSRDELKELPKTVEKSKDKFTIGTFAWNGKTVAQIDSDVLNRSLNTVII